MSAVLANNFLEPEPHIVARLELALQNLQPRVHVLTSADLAKVSEMAQLTPAVHVVWSGFRVVEQRADYRLARLEHTWLIVAAVRNVQSARDGSAARHEAGDLIARAGAALMGYRAPNTAKPMALAPSAPSAHYSAGFMYLPLPFLVETHFHQAAA